MFNPLRMMRVLGRVLCVVVPFVLIALILGVVTELYAHDVPLATPQRVLKFWPQIVRDIVPALVTMFIAYWLAARLAQSLYGLQKLRQGFGFLWRWRFGQMGFSPYLLIQEGHIARDKDRVLTRLGGPGNLVIYNDSAVVLERTGRLTRVEPSSFVPLGPFERVYKAIDLRPKRRMQEVQAMTREGIPVTCEADIGYRISGRDQEPTKKLPYPVARREVLKAATCTWKCEPRFSEDEELDWEELIVLAYTDAALRSILARYPLDQLIGPSGWEENESHPRQAIKEELERKLRAAARNLGAEILSVNLGDIVVRDEVTEQWIAAWKTESERQMMQRRAEGEAEYVAQAETAEARAQADMILALVHALQSLVGDTDALQNRLGLLRTVSMLSHMSQDRQTQPFLSVEGVRDLVEPQKRAKTTEAQQR